MKRLGIISAMELENRKILNETLDLDVSKYSGFEYITGFLYGKPVVIATCGVGKVNASICTQIMIDRFDLTGIIMTGISGSMDPLASHLSVIIAERFTYHDMCKAQMESIFPFKSEFAADEKLSTILSSSAKTALRGLIISGDEFISDKDKKLTLKEKYPDALAVDMESCGAAHTAYVNGVSFVSVRCISDMADDTADKDYDDFEDTAANVSAEIVIKAINSM